MFLLTVDRVALRIQRREILTSGAQNIYLCQFTFSPDWLDLDKTAVFQTDGAKINVVLDPDGRCQIPHEVLLRPFVKLYAGVYGTKNGELVKPTVLCELGRVEKGVALGEEAAEPTPGIYDQILASANEAVETVRDLKADADAGRFDGADGVDGVDGVDGATPEIGANGNWFIGGVDTGKPSRGEDGTDTGYPGEDGATYTPSVDADGNLSWTNNRGFANPATVNIKGPKGDTGAAGDTPVIGANGNWYVGGIDTGRPSQGAPGTSSGEGGSGENGATFTPAMDAAGNLSWSNDRGLVNPATVNIMGPKPVKGTDYWTQADQQQMVEQVLAALPDGDEVSY